MRGLQHGLVEVLSEGLRREPLQGPSAAVLHGAGLFLQRRGQGAALEDLLLPVGLHQLGLVVMGQRRRSSVGRARLTGGSEHVAVQEALGLMQVGRGGAGGVWVRVSV